MIGEKGWKELQEELTPKEIITQVICGVALAIALAIALFPLFTA